MDELTPLLREFLSQPVAFLGGLVSGVLRLDLHEDPLKTWLEQQGACHKDKASATRSDRGERNGRGPQTITID